MSIPGEGLPNSHAAIAFVGWYNGHPDCRDLPVDLPCERAKVCAVPEMLEVIRAG
jgi:ferredoxin/flavodoxin---NADP+ reductase